MGWFSGFEIPLLSERVARLRELGQGLMDGIDFHFTPYFMLD